MTYAIWLVAPYAALGLKLGHSATSPQWPAAFYQIKCIITAILVENRAGPQPDRAAFSPARAARSRLCSFQRTKARDRSGRSFNPCGTPPNDLGRDGHAFATERLVFTALLHAWGDVSLSLSFE
jgi:hypothetical protein